MSQASLAVYGWKSALLASRFGEKRLAEILFSAVVSRQLSVSRPVRWFGRSYHQQENRHRHVACLIQAYARD